MNIEQMAIDAGDIVVQNGIIYWTENDALEVLERFAMLVKQMDVEPAPFSQW
jgi:hypothetical protein